MTPAAQSPGPVRLPVRFQQVLPLRIALGLGEGDGGLPFPLDQIRTTLTFSGTASIYQAFRALKLAPGSVVLCPSYNCGHEIEPLLRLGLRPKWYRVGRDVESDLDDIRRRFTEEVRAVLVTHFFGFAQPLDELRVLCDRWGAFLVEDCAHAFLSDNAAGTLGRTGDASIFSLRKTLPLPNGGAVLLNAPELLPPGELENPPRLTTWLKAVSLTTKSVLDDAMARSTWQSWSLLAAMAPLAAGNEALRRYWPSSSPAAYDPDAEDFDFTSRILEWRISDFSRAVISRIEWRSIAERRRRNYRRLAEGLDGLHAGRVIRPAVPDSTCPLVLPIEVDDSERVSIALDRCRINSAVWWNERHAAVDWEQFPDAARLKDRVLALPVHQDMSDAQVDYVATELRRILTS
jgi:dTDP-4-amino-4,6-dideoxygalactose transaminase